MNKDTTNLNGIINALPPQTKEFFLEMVAILDNLPFGYLQPKIEVHNKKVVSASFDGWRKLKYDDNNIKALEDVIRRIHEVIDKKRSDKISFMLDLKNGTIKEVYWKTQIVRRYEGA